MRTKKYSMTVKDKEGFPSFALDQGCVFTRAVGDNSRSMAVKKGFHFRIRFGIAETGMKAWEQMQLGAIKLMGKYAVQTCGYCSEVQVGPKGHRVRQCQAFKHQMRDGQHAWQEATIDDLVPPVYVWHVRDHQAGAFVDALKRYYGKLPAVVELFAQAGAKVGESYTGVMREDVVVPELDEEKLVV